MPGSQNGRVQSDSSIGPSPRFAQFCHAKWHVLWILIPAIVDVLPAVGAITRLDFEERSYVNLVDDYAFAGFQIDYPVLDPYQVTYRVSALAEAAPPPPEPPLYNPTAAGAITPYFSSGPPPMGVHVEGPGFVIVSGWSYVSADATDSASFDVGAGGAAYLIGNSSWGGDSSTGAAVSGLGGFVDAKTFTTEAIHIDAGQAADFKFSYQPGARAVATANALYNVPDAHAAASASAGWTLTFIPDVPEPSALVLMAVGVAALATLGLRHKDSQQGVG
jgi:hypothetical protein